MGDTKIQAHKQHRQIYSMCTCRLLFTLQVAGVNRIYFWIKITEIYVGNAEKVLSTFEESECMTKKVFDTSSFYGDG
jgi:hypothetical protein